MERQIDRKFTLSSDDVQEAIWRWLKERHDVPVPDSPDKITLIHELPSGGKMQVSWTEHAIIPNV